MAAYKRTSGFGSLAARRREDGGVLDVKPHMRSRPVLKDMMNDLVSIVKWQCLMINMGVKNDEIERKFPSDVNCQKQEAFKQWLHQTPTACWKNVIDALFEMDENTLARELTRKYEWNDPRVYVSRSLVCDPGTRIKIELMGDVSCRKYLPPLQHGQEYHTLQVVSPPHYRSKSELASTTARLINETKPHNLREFLKKIEESESKGDFKVGIDARFGKVYYKLPDDTQSKTPPRNHRALLQSKVLKKNAFNPEVEERDLKSLLEGKDCICESLRVNVSFSIEGQDEGKYIAVISESKDDRTFSLDAIYREPASEKKTRLNIALPGRKYDFRIGDCSELILSEHPNSRPSQIAQEIVAKMHRPSERNLSLVLCGRTEREECTWKVRFIRQRTAKQYRWKQEKKWILARYDVDVFNCEACQTLNLGNDSPLLNQDVAIPEFDYSRIEIELWGHKIHPVEASDTHQTKEVREKPIEGYNWTTEGLMKDFEEFLQDAFTIAEMLDS